ncbi:MAG: hypothetical protein JXA28_05295 [Bacteroidetes bacterium]|nr:hypothetical protein [Bacteroidota bacterium]
MQHTRDGKVATNVSDIRVDTGDQREMIVGNVPQGYETNIRVRLVPGRDLDITAVPRGCRSRTGAPRRDAEPLDLPADLTDKLKKADKAVVAWLAQDEANARLFMARPVEALLKAGVELTRTEQKAIERTHQHVRDTAVVAPGVKVDTLTVTAFPKGRIGKIKPDATPQNTPDSSTGCAKEV